MKKYTIKTQCSNCGKIKIALISNGVSIEEYLSIVKCSNCGCNSLQQEKNTFPSNIVYK